MKFIFFVALIFAQANILAMMAGDSKREIEQLKSFIAEHGIAALSKQAREYFEEKGINFSHLAISQNHSQSGDYHRMVVEEFIKTFGKDAVCPAIRNQIVANGWHKESELMANFAPEPSFFDTHKIPLIIVGAIAIGLLAYEIFAQDDEVSGEEKEEADK